MRDDLRTEPGQTPAPSPYVSRLPIGERIELREGAVPTWEVFPFEGEIRAKVLAAPVLPEPPRHGEDGAETCGLCTKPDSEFLWTDERWRLSDTGEPSGLPAALLLQPRDHHDLADLPAELAAEIGPMLQRVERAVRTLGGIARVHVNRWGDGAAHLHLWLIARPEGMVQMRGTCLPLWDEVLPPLPEAEWRETNRRIALAMAAEGGTAHC
ncbi:hypothetical protein CFP65_0613 [Kitasatospora sp. MMS16-BH015]|uniref:HIT family protein n=1 Tax=Kitasatospora sp. MMS16-BH015 TaxID=2018025 RepID=UPI000CA268AF|nr:hypothetical protein [Kitasatospora sp. MMS16-BH015]AUG75570.1 hypothetical protein CFP65_0613 [Kitasatospora sp. MMS16-BH015]